MPIEQTDKAAGKNLLAAFFISMLYLIMNINNNNFQKNSNISRIIETIWRQGEVSRIDIARSLELYRSTVSNIIGSLIENNIIIETSSGESLPQGGRKPIYLNLNTNFGCVIGFEIQPKKYHAVIIDLNSSILFSSTEETPSAELDDICTSIFPSLIEKTKELGLPLLGICVGLPGIIDSNHGKIIRSDPFDILQDEFVKRYTEQYKIPVLIENDANCCAWLQLTLNRKENLQDFILLLAEYHKANPKKNRKAGMGVGLALSLQGKVRYGKDCGAGEFVSNSWKSDSPGQTGLAEDVLETLLTNDVSYEKWVVDLFSTLVPFISILAPECLYIHGQPAHKKEFINSIIEAKIPQFMRVLDKTKCTLIFSSDSEYDVAQGAAAMFLQRLFSVPDFSEIGSPVRFDWDSLFSLARTQKDSLQKA